MAIEWITAFVDRASDGFDAAASFWCSASGSSLSPWRGENDEFATLLPLDGADSHLRIQRLVDGSPGSHIDLHAADIGASVEVCLASGANVLAEHGGFTVLESPGGLPFCVVAHNDERNRERPVIGATSTTLIDQVSIDTDPDVFDAEVRFWSAVTGWPTVGARSAEFTPLDRPATMPLRIMLQRRDTTSGPASCHLDIACDDRSAAVEDHRRLGATVVSTNRYWTVMTDPVAVAYCLTDRLPTTGLLLPLR